MLLYAQIWEAVSYLFRAVVLVFINYYVALHVQVILPAFPVTPDTLTSTGPLCFAHGGRAVRFR